MILDKLSDCAGRLGVRIYDSPVARLLLTRAWYSLVSKLDRCAEATLLNYGFAFLDGRKIKLGANDEINRYPIQLYHHVATGVPLAGKEVLEVGCGRGGGASYMARYLRPRRVAAVDLNATAIRFDQGFYKDQENLEFLTADAQDLPFPVGSFDAVVNVESSHHYPDMRRFLREVKRVLRPGGHLLMAAYRSRLGMPLLQRELGHSGLKLVAEHEITSNVLKALDLDHVRRAALIRKLSPWFLRRIAKEFAGVPNTELYDSFASGELPYFNFIYRNG